MYTSIYSSVNQFLCDPKLKRGMYSYITEDERKKLNLFLITICIAEHISYKEVNRYYTFSKGAPEM